MAKSKDASWLPSGGVLVAALVCAVVAAILVNIYIGYAKSAYELGAKNVLQLTADVPLGTPVLAAQLKIVKIPGVLLDAFDNAIQASDKDTLVVNHKALRDLRKGQILFYADLIENEVAKGQSALKPGYQMITIPIDSASSLGQQLQPGGYVTIYGDFDFSADPKKPDIQQKEVMKNVQVRALGGSTEPVGPKGRQYDTVQIILRESQARQMMQIKTMLRSRHFTLAMAGTPEGVGAGEPDISKEILNLIEKPRGGAAPAPLPPPP
jgi:Flp pilus assembly protein CpaB